jgi:ribonuclease III
MVDLEPHRHRQLQNLILRLGLPTTEFQQWSLLDQAMTHASVSGTWNYEHLEFIGDAVVRLVVAAFLQEHYPDSPVGEWSAIRSVLVSDRTLAQIADSYGLDRFLVVSTGAISDPGGQTSRLAESFEALLAVLYLSQPDLSLIRPWLDPHWHEWAKTVKADPAYHNYKAALQTWTQSHFHALPEYRVKEHSSPHPKAKNTQGQNLRSHRFYAQVWFRGQQWGEGWGASIKEAEKMAAEQAYLALTETTTADSAPPVN